MAIGNLLILMLILKKFLFKPVQKILKQREEEVAKIYSDADDALAKANEDKNTYEQKMMSAKQEADNLIKTATERAKQESSEIVAAARSEAERRLKNADEDIELAKRKAADEMKNSAHSALIDEAIDSLGDMYEK